MSEEREQLEALWPEGQGVPPFPSDAHAAYWTRRQQWLDMLDAGAYLSAAEMLVPEGCCWSSGDALTNNRSLVIDDNRELVFDGTGSTPAFALCAAIRAARDAQ